jgi:excisionase family DNA binding protein
MAQGNPIVGAPMVPCDRADDTDTRCRDSWGAPTFNKGMDERSKLTSAPPRDGSQSAVTRAVPPKPSGQLAPDGFVHSDTIAPKGSKRSGGSIQLPRLVDISEIAEHLGVTVRHVRQLVAERRIPYVKWGKLLRFDPDEISNWLAGRSVDPLIRGRPGR